MKKILTIVILGVGLALLFTHSTKLEPLLEYKKEAKEVTPITMIFVGDVMFDRGVRRSIENKFSGDYNALFTHTTYLKDVDIAFANLEGPVATGGRKVGSIYSFRMDPKGLEAMKDAGFDVVSFANNHVGDYALEAFTETLTHLKTNNILYTGAGETYANAAQPAVIEVRGVKVGFLAVTDVGPEWMKATETRAGILLASDPNLPEIITEADKAVDILVMSFHWGDEYSPFNKRQESLAYLAIDNGADVIVGHHPHVMQKVAEYKGKVIFYSLGNYIFDQYFSLHTMRGIVGRVSIDPETKAVSVEKFISPQARDFIPQPLTPFDEALLITKPMN